MEDQVRHKYLKDLSDHFGVIWTPEESMVIEEYTRWCMNQTIGECQNICKSQDDCNEMNKLTYQL